MDSFKRNDVTADAALENDSAESDADDEISRTEPMV